MDNHTFLDILQYILFNTFGDYLETESWAKKEIIEPQLIDFEHPLTNKFTRHIKVKSSNLCFFEIRIHTPPIQDPYIETDKDEIKDKIKKKFEQKMEKVRSNLQLIGWYYEFINSKFPQKCPLTYSFR